MTLGIADLVTGSIERVGQRIRSGELDVWLVRPVPAFIQAAADNFALRRIGRPLQAGDRAGLRPRPQLDIDWTVAKVVCWRVADHRSAHLRLDLRARRRVPVHHDRLGRGRQRLHLRRPAVDPVPAVDLRQGHRPRRHVRRTAGLRELLPGAVRAGQTGPARAAVLDRPAGPGWSPSRWSRSRRWPGEAVSAATAVQGVERCA